MARWIRGGVAVIGAGDTPYYPRGKSPDSEMKLALRAIVAACEDAGISPAEVDGFVSYADDKNDPARLIGALGTRELHWTSMVWGGGGGGSAGALGAAAAAILSGQAETVVVYRALAQRDSGRLSEMVTHGHLGAHYEVQGIVTPAQICALRTERMLSQGVPRSALEAVVRADYFHAQSNPAAQARGKMISPQQYANGRSIADPLNLFDCSRENDAAGAVLLTSAERARDLVATPVYLLAATQGCDPGRGEIWETDVDYHSSGFNTVARRLWEQSGFAPNDVDVVQVYENFSGPAVGALIDHGFCTVETAGNVLTFENMIAPSGGLPINTAGGLIGEGNVHGMGLAVEAVRQLTGRSHNPVPNAKICLVTGGPAAPIASSALFGTSAAL